MKKSIYTDPSFLRYLIGFSASGLASWGLVFILGISVVDKQISAEQLGFALAYRTFGFLVGVMLGGVFADRFSRRKVIFACSMIAALGTALMLFGFSLSILLMYLGCIISGIGQGAIRPAFQAYTTAVVEENQLESANASLSLVIRLAILFGPMMVNVIVLIFNLIAAYYLLIALWLICAFFPPWIIDESIDSEADDFYDTDEADDFYYTDDTEQDYLAEHSYIRSIFSMMIDSVKRTVREWLEGLQEAKKHPWFLYGLTSSTVVVALGYSTTNVLLPVVAKQADSLELMTHVITSYTVGSILCAMALNKFKPRPRGWFALFGASLYGFVPLGLLFSNIYSFTVISYFIAGVGMELNRVIWFSSVQREIPQSHLARVSSLDFLFSYGLAPLGLVFIAPAANIIGLDMTLIICALACFIAPIMAMIEKSSKHYSVKTC